ncbi:bleomycin resistance protein [Neogemmobacter tilapiae]|uniref:Bleomycin resistance protein n=1 Tax=Neogemmobacter tilapiae TaxID=875041 RepID=A0A918TPU4_9RHOB|nr:VOC family protein [Gemmobacter tilapiae]GHC54220.1 glyoxalase [Gemmobacter tilapiae]
MPLTPELSVRDWRVSRAFYRDVLGFAVAYERPEEGFCFLERDGAALMIDQIGLGRDFDGGHLPKEYPFGRGVNFQIEVSALTPILARLAAGGFPLLIGPEEKWYRRGDQELGQRQIAVADPDGYLLRLFEGLGERKII